MAMYISQVWCRFWDYFIIFRWMEILPFLRSFIRFKLKFINHSKASKYVRQPYWDIIVSTFLWKVRVALNMGVCIVWLPTNNLVNHMPISNFSVYYRWSWIKLLVLVCINWRCIWYDCKLSHRFICWKHNVTSLGKTSKSHR